MNANTNQTARAIYGPGNWTPAQTAEAYGLAWAELTAWALEAKTAAALGDLLARAEYVREADGVDTLAEALAAAYAKRDEARALADKLEAEAARALAAAEAEAAAAWEQDTRDAVADAWAKLTPGQQAREAVKRARLGRPGWDDWADADGFGLSRLESLARSLANAEAGRQPLAAVLA